MRSLFYKRLRCKHCNGSFKRKSERGKRNVYICTNYDSRNGKCDRRIPIPEQFIIDVVNKRYKIRKGITLSDQAAADKVVEMIVEDKNLFTIKLKDFEDEIVYGRTKLIF